MAKKIKNKHERMFILLMIEGSTGSLIKDIKSKKTKIKQMTLFVRDIREFLKVETEDQDRHVTNMLHALLKEYEDKNKENKEKTREEG